jgi:dTDP-4-dehydrorhamnose 3,5-epimerase
MEVEKLKLDGLLLIKPRVFPDARGFFLESFQEERYRNAGIATTFVQDNHSRSNKGILRGLHYQSSPGQAKLMRVGRGRIFDVAVDIRPDSPTFGQWEGVILDDESHHQLLVPVGFAHGFCVLSEVADVHYKVSSPYNPDTECGLAWDDADIGVDWPLDDVQVSDRDKANESFAEYKKRVGR